jgi:hypothetical protein
LFSTLAATRSSRLANIFRRVTAEAIKADAKTIKLAASGMRSEKMVPFAMSANVNMKIIFPLDSFKA